MSAEINNTENYTSDSPISEQRDDQFQRYGFSKRIADTIKTRKNKESIVFGLFGAWGEGKTSILNFIEEELKTDDEIITIKLNPWRYSDEDSLLRNYFDKIAQALGKKMEKWNDKIGGFITKYGSLTSFFGVDISTVGQAFSDADIEKYKERINDFLSESNSKIVVFVDDIDRLDKQEIYSLFRLVKLTADFSNTTYILSFDESMVAAAIGERFGAGDKKSGASFLEKIIQVPLTIPKAQPDALKRFCLKLINNAIDSAEITVEKKEGERFIYQFTTSILPKLTTPRLAVRYGNTLSFSLPLLNGEVNIVDLMLIEAVKIFYPEHYAFIKHHPEYFVGSPKDFFLGSDRNSETVNSHFEEIANGNSGREKSHIKYLINSLFPNKAGSSDPFNFTDEKENDFFVQKRIVSPKYFDRYFSYAVIEGGISDIEFDRLIKEAETSSIQDLATGIKNIIATSDAGSFVQKLRSRETDYTWEQGKILLKALCDNSDLLPNSGGMLGFGAETPFGQASIFAYQVLRQHEKEHIFEFAKELMTYPQDFQFAYTINNWLRTGDRPEEKLFKTEEYDELAKLLVQRAIADAGDDSVFEKYPNQILYILYSWELSDETGFKKYTEDYLNKGKDHVLKLLKAFVPVGRSNARAGEFKTDITKNQYEYIVDHFDKDNLYARILENFSLETLNAEKPYWIDFGEKEYSDLNMARQFVQWYDKGKETIIPE